MKYAIFVWVAPFFLIVLSAWPASAINHDAPWNWAIGALAGAIGTMWHDLAEDYYS
jgi:hypothetical protein